MKIKEIASSSKQLEELQSASPNSEIFLVGVISSHNFPFYVLRRFVVTSKFFNKSRDVSVPVPHVSCCRQRFLLSRLKGNWRQPSRL